jgi:hypothetical protein
MTTNNINNVDSASSASVRRRTRMPFDLNLEARTNAPKASSSSVIKRNDGRRTRLFTDSRMPSSTHPVTPYSGNDSEYDHHAEANAVYKALEIAMNELKAYMGADPERYVQIVERFGEAVARQTYFEEWVNPNERRTAFDDAMFLYEDTVFAMPDEDRGFFNKYLHSLVAQGNKKLLSGQDLDYMIMEVGAKLGGIVASKEDAQVKLNIIDPSSNPDSQYTDRADPNYVSGVLDAIDLFHPENQDHSN